MVIGVPRETSRHEHRVGLNPFGVARLTDCGSVVYIERGAGKAAHFSDEDYADAGGRIVYGPEEIYNRADLVCRFGALSLEEVGLLKEESVLCAFHHLAVAPRELVEKLIEARATLIGYEIIRGPDGDLSALLPLSELAGQMAVDTAAQLLRYEPGGRGILLGSAPGLPPATVVILGAGTVGVTAARHAVARGAQVILIDQDIRKLRRAARLLGSQVMTAVGGVARLERYTAIADVLIGAVLIPGGRSPLLVTDAMVRAMKPGSVIIDVSIDQGGCVETSRPTTPEDPTYRVHDVVHCCIPNMTSDIPRTATRAMADGALPFILKIAEKGLERALLEDPGLAGGTYMYKGQMVNARAGEALGIPQVSLAEILRKES
ncbi:MAG: alanine dehydrogenase [Candidatus Eisenbacteria bacterium]|nr:alanine dehydrogenase [Candidatus Eisenbacteria bacterium]